MSEMSPGMLVAIGGIAKDAEMMLRSGHDCIDVESKLALLRRRICDSRKPLYGAASAIVAAKLLARMDYVDESCSRIFLYELWNTLR